MILKYKEEWFIHRKKIKLNDKTFFISVYTYYNNRIHLKYENSVESHDITLNLKDVYIDNDKVLIDPNIEKIGLLKQLKKARIIREICGSFNYNYVEIPVAILNMGILRQYDNIGVSNHLKRGLSYE